MKTFMFSVISLLILLAVPASDAKTLKIVNPLVDHPNTSHIFIDAVEINSDSTIVTFRVYNYMNQHISIKPGAKLVYNGKDYPLRHANGIELGKAIDMPAFGDSIFTISFAPLPMNIQSFDFIEGDSDSDFKLEGIHTDKSSDDETPIENFDLLPQQKWEKGITILKGTILNYQPSDQPDIATLYPRSALGRNIDKNIGTTTVNSDGTFEVTLPVYQSHQPCFFTVPGFYGLIYLSADKESCVTIDPTQRAANGHSGKDESVHFTGANEELNNQLALNIGHDMIWDAFFNNMSRKKPYTSAHAYKRDVNCHAANRRDKIRRLPFTPKMKQLMNLEIESDALMSLASRSEQRHLSDLDSSYYDFYKKIDLADPIMMWADNFDTDISNTYNPYKDNLSISISNIPIDFYKHLMDSGKIAEEDSELVKSIISHNIDRLPQEVVDGYALAAAEKVRHYSDSLNLHGSERNSAETLISHLNSGELKKYNDVKSHYLAWIFKLKEWGHKLPMQNVLNFNFDNEILSETLKYCKDNASVISAFNAKYANQYDVWNFENKIDTAIDNFTNLYGKESPIINRLFAAHAYNDYIEDRNTLSTELLANCRRRLPDVFFDHVMAQNDAMAKVLAQAKYNVLEMKPENSGDEILKEIADKFKGKVIYIDIWGTWCGSCISAINEIQPVKKDYADNVVFVYLADETSPRKAWEEKIKSIDGEHLRLSASQMHEIMSRFSFNGYPSYIVIGKDGGVTYSGLIHGLHNVKKILDEAIAK